MICPNCGQTTVAGSVFCDNCGIRLNMPDIDPQSRLDAVMDDQFNSFGQTISTESEFSADFDPRTADTVLNQQYQSQASASPVFTQQFQPQSQASATAAFTQQFQPQSQASATAAFTQQFQPQPQASATAAFTQQFQPQPQASAPSAFTQQFQPQPQASATAAFTQQFQPQPQASAPPAFTQQFQPQPQASAPSAFTQQFQPQPQPQAETFEPSNMGEVAAPVFSPATGGDAAGKDGESTSFFSTEQLYLPVSIGNWIGTFVLLFLIPLAFGVIACFIGDYFLSDTIWSTVIALAPMVAYIAMLFIYAFNSKVNPSKRNYFRAILILSLILIIIVGILVVVFSSFLASYVGNLENSEQLQHWINSIPV